MSHATPHAKVKHEEVAKPPAAVGDKLFFVPDPTDPIAGGSPDLLVATVAKVNGDGTVNLSIIGHDGQAEHKQNVPVAGGGRHTPKDHGFAQVSPTRELTTAEAFAGKDAEEPKKDKDAEEPEDEDKKDKHPHHGKGHHK